jgi:type I restriction enzyme R subunit
VVIEAALALGLPRAYTPELYQQKCKAMFAHIEQAYPERDRSVYSLDGLTAAAARAPGSGRLKPAVRW